MKNSEEAIWDCVVIGGGLAGLTASIFLARAGLSVLLLERSKKLGGRAGTELMKGNYLNLGPHALYSKGKSMEILSQLEIIPQGDHPPIKGKLLYKDKIHELPAEPWTLLISDLFTWKGKQELLRFFISLKKVNVNENQDITISQWLNQNIKDEHVKKFILMLIRLSTYCHEPDLMSAYAALNQLQLGKALYLDYGWQTLIEALTEQALKSGVTIKSRSAVHGITGLFPKVRITSKNNESIFAKTVLSTASPGETVKMLQEHRNPSTLECLNELLPVRAACLDIVLSKLPEPDTFFAMSMDQPLYFSNHSKVARLTENENYSVVHVMKYLRFNEIQEELEVKYELELFTSRLQPGWEKFVVYKRFLPRLIVSHGMLRAKKARPAPVVKEIPGLFIAGDWVGAEGMLTDASFTSAKQAAVSIIAMCR